MTLEELKALDNRAFDLEVAKVAGWREGKNGWYRPGERGMQFKAPSSPPRFSEDLNDTHTVEAGLTEEQMNKYTRTLIDLKVDIGYCGWTVTELFSLFHADARTRAIALAAIGDEA